MNHPHRSALLLAGVLATAALHAQSAPAAPPTSAAKAPAAETIKLEAFTITGSNIRRVEAETSLPVTIIDQESMDLRGASTPAELFDTVTFASPPLLTEQESAGQSARGDNTSLDLRGLGSGSTLVLVNGRRMPPHPISQSENGTPALSVNANTVPFALATCVEILRDGASAIYGSDAAAGVVNYILAPRFDGFRTTFRTAMTLEGGGNENRAGFLWGDSKLNGGKTGVLLGLDFFHRDALVPGDRWWSQNADQRRIRKLPAPWNGLPVTLPDGTVVRDNDFDNSPGTNRFGTYTRGTVNPDLSVSGSRPTGNAGIVTTQPSPFATMTTGGVFFLTPIDATGTVGFRSSTPSRNFDSPERDFYQNTNNGSIILPRSSRSNLTASVTHKLNDRLTAFGEFIGYYGKTFTGRVGPQIDIADALGITAGVNNPFNPFGSRFYSPTGAPNADGSLRLTGAPSPVALTLVRPTDFPTRVITVRSTS